MEEKTGKLTKSTKFTLGVLKRLERLKKGDFKRKFKVKSINDVVEKLLDCYDEYLVLKEQSKGIVETGKIAEASILEMEEEVIPSVCPDCLNYSSCSKPVLKDDESIFNHVRTGCFKARNQCVFRSQNPEGNVDCAKDFAKTGRIHNVTKDFCNNCWERKQHILRKMKGIENSKSQIVPEEKPQRSKKTIIEKIKNGTLEIECSQKRTRLPMLKLPCMENTMYKCPNTSCNEHILRLIGISSVTTFLTTEEQPKTEETIPLPKTIECDNSIYRIEEPKHLLNLPCLRNPMFPCNNPECKAIIQKWIEKEGWKI